MLPLLQCALADTARWPWPRGLDFDLRRGISKGGLQIAYHPCMENCIALKDPVCGMPVTIRSFHQSEHKGHLFYFCSARCKAKFSGNALRYCGELATTDFEQVVDEQVRVAQPPAAKWHRGWWLAFAGLLALVMGGLWMV